MPRVVPVHYLRPNEAEWTPPAVVFADTETATRPHPAGDLEVLRCWVAHYLDRRPTRGASLRDVWGQGTTGDQLAAWLTDVTRNRRSVWAYCHNLGFDLTTTGLLRKLSARGWQITEAAVGGTAPWVRLARGSRRLCLTDSFSWLETNLARIGQAVGTVKPALPAQGDDLDAWLARCRADVTILESAVLTLMGWWDAKRLGNWTITGAACGWNAYRHTPTSTRMVIDPDPDKVNPERAFVHGGRRAVWSVGEHAAGPFTELDFAAAYPTVAAHLPLPIQRTAHRESTDLSHYLIRSQRWSLTARCLIRTDVPRWPVKLNKGTWYPVGRFWADLAGPDITEADRLGCLLEVGPGWVHQLGYNMAPWARWVTRTASGADPDTPEVARMVAKSWSRSVIGRWSQRGYQRLQLGPAPGPGWGFEEGWDHYAGVRGQVVDLDGRRAWVSAAETPDNAYPAVLAFVEAHVRTRLNRVIDALGPGCVLQADTDGLIVRDSAVGTHAARGTLVAPPSVPAAGRLQWCLDQLAPDVAPLVLRAKRRLSHVTVLGPQHVARDGVRGYSGLPGMAEPVGGDRYRVKQWPGLSWQLAHGDAAGYVRPEVTVTMRGPWPTGWLLADGSVVPVEADVTSTGETRLIGWNSSSYAFAGMRPASTQHPRLAPLL